MLFQGYLYTVSVIQTFQTYEPPLVQRGSDNRGSTVNMW